MTGERASIIGLELEHMYSVCIGHRALWAAGIEQILEHMDQHGLAGSDHMVDQRSTIRLVERSNLVSPRGQDPADGSMTGIYARPGDLHKFTTVPGTLRRYKFCLCHDRQVHRADLMELREVK